MANKFKVCEHSLPPHRPKLGMCVTACNGLASQPQGIFTCAQCFVDPCHPEKDKMITEVELINVKNNLILCKLKVDELRQMLQ